jgi:hypothetical protein
MATPYITQLNYADTSMSYIKSKFNLENRFSEDNTTNVFIVQSSTMTEIGCVVPLAVTPETFFNELFEKLIYDDIVVIKNVHKDALDGVLEKLCVFPGDHKARVYIPVLRIERDLGELKDLEFTELKKYGV